MNHLKQVSELQPYYEANEDEFNQLVLSSYKDYNQLSQRALLHLATLRSMEVCNGIVQWSYRLKHPDALSVEQTRQCMKLSLSCIHHQKIHNVSLDNELSDHLTTVRKYYNEGVKQHNSESYRLFHVHSTAQFLAIPIATMFDAFKFMHNNYEYLFTSAYLASMRRYILRYYTITM